MTKKQNNGSDPLPSNIDGGNWKIGMGASHLSIDNFALFVHFSGKDVGPQKISNWFNLVD